MPKYYVKHIPPPTICTRFSPEREAVPFKLTVAEEHTHEARTEGQTDYSIVDDDNDEDHLVFNKPSGDVAKHYRLKDVVCISDVEFKVVQVRSF